MQVTSIAKPWSVQMHRSKHSVSTYFRTQAPVYQAQATQPLTQQYSYSTYISSGRLQAQLTQTYAIQTIPAPVIITRKKRNRKVTYKHKTARRDTHLF